MFWTHSSYAVVGNSARMPFPKLTYGGLKKLGKTVYPIDPGTDTVEGDQTFRDIASCPKVEAVVLEVPTDESAAWVEKAAAAGIRKIWIHLGTETPEAIAAAKKYGVEILTGTCAVMYLTTHFSPHAIHRFIMKLLKKY